MPIARLAATTVALACVAATNVSAHVTAQDPATGGISGWDGAVLLLLAVAAMLYGRGAHVLAVRGARVRPAERAAFWVGWLAMITAVAPPVDSLAVRLFSFHMVQHELLLLVGAPLVIAGRPIVPWLWALPGPIRQSAGGGLHRAPARSLWRALTRPAIAWALHGATIWIWHAPVFYQAAIRNEAVHALQHATFVGTAVLFWWGLIYGRYGRIAYGAAVLYVFTTAVHTSALGALITFAAAPLYPLYAARAAERGIDAIGDQQLAGMYMWVPAGIVLTIFGLVLLVAWLAEADRRSRIAHR
jgi:putative membrane protein